MYTKKVIIGTELNCVCANMYGIEIIHATLY